MPDLVAQGQEPEQVWRRPLPATTIVLGRVQKCDWETPWDDLISRRHATLHWKDGKLLVRKLPESRNPIFYRGNEVQEFSLGLGEHFVIGQTTFFVEAGVALPARQLQEPVAELTCSYQELAKVGFGAGADRIEALARLPELIRFTPSDETFERRVLEVLLEGLPGAAAAALVWLDIHGARPLVDSPSGGKDAATEVRVCLALGRGGVATAVQPSRRLVNEAIRRRRQPVMHSWLGGANGEPSNYTTAGGSDWAICAPLPDDPAPGWALYVLGKSPSEDARMEDWKFAGLVADIFGQLRQVRDLQKRRRLLESFLSPKVVAHLASLPTQNVDEILRPSAGNVTVLFCDLRGFSKMAEDEGDLPALCDRVSEALRIMTRNIIREDGVIGDFQGDAAMGFWGWPAETPDQVQRAAVAALGIRREFSQARLIKGHPLAEFTCGIGIAHGPGIAGRLGTLDQFKVGAFGPAVNLAARLESLTKVFGVPIIMDETAALKLAGAEARILRLRRLARVRPFGMSRAWMAHELLAPSHEPGAMTESLHYDYDAALENFLRGRWDHALKLVDRLPQDTPSQLLRAFIHTHKTPPRSWDGTLTMDSK